MPTLPPGPPLYVNSAGMDFERYPKVIVILRVVVGGRQHTNTMTFDAASADVQSWAPPREPGTPIEYTMLLTPREGPQVRVEGVETSEMLMVLPPRG